MIEYNWLICVEIKIESFENYLNLILLKFSYLLIEFWISLNSFFVMNRKVKTKNKQYLLILNVLCLIWK